MFTVKDVFGNVHKEVVLCCLKQPKFDWKLKSCWAILTSNCGDFEQ